MDTITGNYCRNHICFTKIEILPKHFEFEWYLLNSNVFVTIT